MKAAGGQDSAISVVHSTPEVAGKAPSRGLRVKLDAFMTPAGLLLGAAFVLAMFAVTSPIRDPDFWWHLRAGQLILQHGGLLGTDPFTYTAVGHSWTMHEWLTEVSYAALVSAFGIGAVILVLSAVTWLGIVAVAAKASLDKPNRLVFGLGLLLAVIAGYPIWGPRVQMVTFCFSAITLLLVERHLTRDGRGIWLLVPLFLVWSNLHSGFVIGLGFIGLILVAELAGPLFRMPDPAQRSRLRPLALVLLAGAALSLINPNGPGILLYAFETQSSAAQQSLILEWHSPDFHDWAIVAYGVMLVSLLVLITLTRRIRARDAALVLATVALSLQSARHIALFVAATTPVWIDQASMLLERRHGRTPQRRRQQPSLRFRATVFATLFGVLFAGYLGGRLIAMMRIQQNSLMYAQEFPVCAARWLSEAPQPLRIFNQYGEGGYLAYTLSAKGDRVFIFGDAALMGDNLLYQYGDVEGVAPNWESIIDDSHTDIVLFDRNTPLEAVMRQAATPLNARWTIVYQDPLSVAFVQTSKLQSLHLPPPPGPYPSGDVCNQLQTAPINSGAQQ